MNEPTVQYGGWKRSVPLLVIVWLVLQVGGMFSPGLLDDVDSIYTEIAREMLHRHDFVTPTIDGIRFFDKPPLMYWLAAASMRLFGEHDWAARTPIVLAMLALVLAVYGLGRRLYGEQGGFYAALILGTSIGPYLYTRFFIPDIFLCLWMTLGVWLFLLWIESAIRPSAWAALGFGVVLALNLLTKGLIGIVFPIGFCLLYLLLTRQWKKPGWTRTALATSAFAAVALPWHILAWSRNPAIPMPPGLGLPARAGWAWFYLYNEHVARFLGKRIPHDYGNTPVWLFWLYTLVWMMPWAVFLPAAFRLRQHRATLAVTLWAGLVLLFFSISSRQEYYSLPALPALALLLGGVLACHANASLRNAVAACHAWLLLPLAVSIAAVCAWFALTTPQPASGVDLASLLATNPANYNLSLGHLFDLTAKAMGRFRGPLALVAAGMFVLGPASYALRRLRRDRAANLTLAAGTIAALLAAHEGLARFYPILGSKPLAEAILTEQKNAPQPADLIVLDGELTSGSSLLFYTRQPLHLVNGRVNGPWFGSMWPDAPAIFEDEQTLRRLWDGPSRVFLMTDQPQSRLQQLGGRELTQAGGKTLLVNRPAVP